MKIEKLGKLMDLSHESCAKLYDCSSKELDILVGLAKKNGAFGSRLTGAGWGGCSVSMIDETKVSSFIEIIKHEFYIKNQMVKIEKESDWDNVVFATAPGQGALAFQVSK